MITTTIELYKFLNELAVDDVELSVMLNGSVYFSQTLNGGNVGKWTLFLSCGTFVVGTSFELKVLKDDGKIVGTSYVELGNSIDESRVLEFISFG